MKKFLILPLLFILMMTTGQSCQFGFGGGNKDVLPDAGVFKTTNAAIDWVQIKNVPTVSGKPASIGNASVLTMEMDPQDNQAIYLGTERSGIFYTYDGGNTWNRFNNFSSGKVYSISVSPDFKCIIYATLGGTVRKTADCGRNWETVFIENDPKAEITAVKVDGYNVNTVYAGTSKGIIHKSFDQGKTWSTPFSKVSGSISKIMIDPIDTRIMYIATAKNGIYKSVNAGFDWENFDEGLKEFKGYNDYRDLFFNPSKESSLILVSKYGLLKTEDGGISWTSIPLLTAPGAADIRVAAVDPFDDKNIYYATKTIFYKTVNGGSDWETKRLFSTKTPTAFITDPDNSNILYMGFNYPPKQ